MHIAQWRLFALFFAICTFFAFSLQTMRHQKAQGPQEEAGEEEAVPKEEEAEEEPKAQGKANVRVGSWAAAAAEELPIANQVAAAVSWLLQRPKDAKFPAPHFPQPLPPPLLFSYN
jgi:hypothetical protein